MDFTGLTELKRRYTGQAGELVNDFYVPVLSRAVRYDRQAGYFDSASLVQIAAGLAAFIRNAADAAVESRAPMRVVAGATWTEADIEAYRKGATALEGQLNRTLLRHFAPSEAECVRLGLPKGWRPEADGIAKHRLGALAWMVASGLLEIKIALPLDASGNPYKPGRGGALYHPKAGLLYDANGQIVYFQGSVNETGAAWVRNREKFDVKRSWFSDQDREDIQEEIREFNALWRGQDRQLLILPLPKAVKDYLIHYAPSEGPPKRDPMETGIEIDPPSVSDREAARRLLDAPLQPGGESLVLAPLWADGQPFLPYPHQDRVIRKVVAAYPHPYLFCDEVGLGKTIEAGLALRSLILKRRVNRVLLICPRSLIRQWMEELREKLALTAWFYDGRTLKDVGGRCRQVDRPLEEDGILIASRHLMARADRRSEVMKTSTPWDLIIVDEAHAARRKVFGDNAPNQFLDLLLNFKRRGMFGSLWLLTATPMQLDPREVHDLLMLCGLDDPSWNGWSSAVAFTEFFAKLRAFSSDANIRKDVLDMARIAVEKGAPALDENRPPADYWTPFEWRAMVNKVRTGNGLMLALREMPGNKANAMTPFLTRQTPLAVHMFRHTRATLRAYMEHGLVQRLANRRPEDAPVVFQTAEEHDLYTRIDELCSRFYRLADLPPEERSGVGFLMAVFRKRLSSSFEAFRKSLERRKAFIEAVETELDDMDVTRHEADFINEEEETGEEPDVWKALDRERQRLVRMYGDPQRRRELDEERSYLQDYIVQLGRISHDSKFDVFKHWLDRLLSEGRRVIVFTQYLDTLDFLRERLESRFGNQMACYSGRGGEVWDPARNQWVRVEKSEIKARAQKDHPAAVRVLLGTDAASEGLNLQQFSALINYDLPWNPMRVEQRIGRIDRIGQEAPEVKIVNLYVKDTIEEDTYHTLKYRIGAFEEVVGPLQPILAEMPKIFRKVALGQLEIEEARRMLEEGSQKESKVTEDAFDTLPSEMPEPTTAPDHTQPPATQRQLAAWCLAHPAPGMTIRAVPEPGTETIQSDGIQACLAINWTDAPPHLGIDPTEEALFTFDGALADRHPPTAPTQDDEGNPVEGREGVRLLTWGDPYLGAWLGVMVGKTGVWQSKTMKQSLPEKGAENG
jgi:superfamily II DNA or RNA helicase